MTIKPPPRHRRTKPQAIAGPLAGQTVVRPAARAYQAADFAANGYAGSFGYVHNRSYFQNVCGARKDVDVWLPDGWDSADCYRHLLNLHRRCAQAAREGHSLGNAELRRLLKMDSE